MTGPRPVRPVQLPELTVKGGQASPIEVALRLATAPPDIQAIGQANFRQRRYQFGEDLPRAIPGGMVNFLGTLGADVAGLDLPLLPPILPRPQAKVQSMTDQLVARLHALTGATPGSEGTQTGMELGGLLASALPLERVPGLAAKALDEAGVIGSEFSRDVLHPLRASLQTPDMAISNPLLNDARYAPYREAGRLPTRADIREMRRLLEEGE